MSEHAPVDYADESALVDALKARDDDAFERLVRTHAGALLRVTRRFLRNEDDARDAVQDAFLSVLRSIDSFEGGSKLGTWLHRIAINAALQKLRTQRRRPETPIESFLPQFEQDGHHARVVSPWPAADELLAREETRDHVRRAIEQVPESYRVVLLLRDIEGLDTEETARLLSLTQNAVKIRLHRARQALRGLLDPHLRRRG